MATEFHPLTIVITGVTRGLGRAMVDKFHRLGHVVLGCARTKDEIAKLSSEYIKPHDFQIVDVTSDAEVKAWVEHLLKNYSPPDFVLNNAAIINFKASLWEVGAREFSDEVDTNVKGVVNVIRHFVPGMIRRKRGVIVNFSSRWGRKVEKKMAPYCATKWAVEGLTRALAEELLPEGVAAVALNPGIIKTTMLKNYFGSANANNTSGYPSPTEWAEIAVPYILGLGLQDTGRSRKVLKRLKCPV